jgi:APA family basic amino acid/polyamine antiporter
METKDKTLNLKKSLSLFDSIAINIGAIIGGGIFVVTGLVAGMAGSALIVSLILAAGVSLFTAISFARLSARYPKEGGVYEFGYLLVSPLTGFSAGWMWVISNIFVGSALALGFSSYLASMLPGISVRFVAVAITVVFTFLNILGAKSSASVNNVLVVTKVLILAFFVGLGAFHVDQANLQPFEPFKLGVLYGSYYIFFAFAGFARVSLLSEEVKDAKKNVPRAIIISLLVSTVIYMVVAFVAVGLIGSGRLGDSASPLTDAISAVGNATANRLISIGGMIATASVLLTTILGVSRLSYAMALKKDLPPIFGRLHQRFDTPYVAILISSSLMVVLVFLSNLSQIVAVSTLASLIYYGIGNVSALKLNRSISGRTSIVSLLGIVSCAAFSIVIVFKNPEVWIICIGILLAGFLYFKFGRKAAYRFR